MTCSSSAPGNQVAEIAEDLHLAGRRVHLCVGGAPRTARRYRGRDVVDWLEDMGYYRMPVHDHPMKEKVRGKANHYVTGRDGGRDIDLRKFAREGMQLYGRLTDVQDDALHFAADLRANLDQADASADGVKTAIDAYIEANGVEAPTEARYQPVWAPEGEVRSRDLASFNWVRSSGAWDFKLITASSRCPSLMAKVPDPSKGGHVRAGHVFLGASVALYVGVGPLFWRRRRRGAPGP